VDVEYTPSAKYAWKPRRKGAVNNNTPPWNLFAATHKRAQRVQPVRQAKRARK